MLNSFVGKAEEVVPHFYEEMARLAADTSATEAQREEAGKSITPDVVVVDPPRKGCDESLLDTIVKMSPERIVYVSCDSATLARDLGLLAAKGYKTVKGAACGSVLAYGACGECGTDFERTAGN